MTEEAMEEVVSFLNKIGLSEYQQLFEQEAITLDILKEMCNDDANQILKEIGIKPMGKRLKIIHELKKLADTPLEENLAPTASREQPREEQKPTHVCLPGIAADHANKSGETAYAQTAQVMEKISKFKAKSKMELLTTYKEMSGLILKDIIFEELQQEMKPVFGDIVQFIHDKIIDVEDDTCSIFITGETSAGKSSFINLLIGDNILPQSCLSCTSTICRIHNSKPKSISATLHDGSSEKLFDGDLCAEKIQEYLSSIVSSGGKQYRFVDIYWPIAFLKENIMIVDSPGIDPHDPDLTDRIYEYLPNAMLFIYIINPTNGGGVQSDRLLLLHNEMVERTCKEKGVSMDINKGIFICNKWDSVYEHPEKVFLEISFKLKQCWNGFKKEQLFKLSTRNEIKNAQEGKEISPEFSAILLAIEHMTPSGVEEKVARHLQWQTVFTDCVLKCLLARILHAMQSETERRSRIKDVSERIACFRDIIPDIKHIFILFMLDRYKVRSLEFLKQKVDHIICSIHSYLTDPNNHDGIFIWSSLNLPDDGNLGDLQNSLQQIVDERINLAIHKRYSIETQNILDALKHDLTSKCESLFNDVRDMEKIIYGPIVHPVEKENDHKDVIQNQVNPAIPTVLSMFSFTFGIPIGTFIAGFSAMFSLAAFIPAVLVGGIMGAGVESIMNVFNVRGYRKDKVAYVKNLAVKTLEKLTKDILMKSLKPEIMEKVKQFVSEYINIAVVVRIEAVDNLVTNLTKGRVKIEETCEQSYAVQRETFRILGRIILSKMFLFEKDVIQTDDTQNTTTEMKEPNMLVKEETWILASTNKSFYTCDSKEGCTELAEIWSLRKINHQNILKINGIKQMSVQGVSRWHISQEEYETNLEHEVLENNMEWATCLHYLRDSVEGLLFLHQLGLIHKNFRLRCIKIKENTGKLSDGVVTQETPLTGIIDGIPIITAPEILQKSMTGPEVDIFNFGFAMWESWYHKYALCMSQDHPQISTYEELSSAIINGKRPIFEEQIPAENIKSLIEKCWSDQPVKRPTTKEIKEIIISLIEE